MKRPTFFEGVAVALIAALLGGGLYGAATVLLAPATALRLLVAALGLGYGLYLSARSGARIGRLTLLALWSAVALAAWWLAPSLALYGLAHLAMVWLARSVYFHSGPLAALADGALCGIGALAGLAAALHTGSLALGIWCFFLVQALFAAIPPAWPARASAAQPAEDRFEQAHRKAEAALRRLLSPAPP